MSYFRSNPLCANFAYVFLDNYSIDFDQASVKSRSDIFCLKKLKKIRRIRGSNFGNGGICKPHFYVLGNLVCVKL